MDASKLKRLVIIVVVAIVILLVVRAFFGERISDFMNGFVTGISLTLLVASAIYFWRIFKKK